MQGEAYEAPAVEDRTAVGEPLNTTQTISEIRITPEWRRGDDVAGPSGS